MAYKLLGESGLEIAEGNYLRRFKPGEEVELSPGEMLRLERFGKADRFIFVDEAAATSAKKTKGTN